MQHYFNDCHKDFYGTFRLTANVREKFFEGPQIWNTSPSV